MKHSLHHQWAATYLTFHGYMLENACFTPWLAFESRENSLAIMSLMKIIWPIHSVLGEYRLMKSCEDNVFSDLKRQGRLKNNLSAFLSNTENHK